MFFNGRTDPAVNVLASEQGLVSLVPNATSGRITVTTPSGTAVSAQDFFIPPPGHSASQVEVTGRVNINETRNVRIDRNGNLAILIFDGTAGTSVNLGFTDIFPSNSLFWLNKPDGTTLSTQTILRPLFIVENIFLPVSGTYSLILKLDDLSGALQMNVGVYSSTNLNRTIIVDGPAETISITTPGQYATLNFSANQGQTLALDISNVSVPLSDLRVAIPGGNIITLINDSGDVIRMADLPQTGTYQIIFDPVSTYTGSATFALRNINDISRNLIIDGPAETIPLNVAGQAARLQFNYAQESGILLNITNNSITDSRLFISSPSGGYVISNLPVAPGNTSIPLTNLTTSGIHEVYFVPQHGVIGETTFSLTSNPDVQGLINIDGPPLTIGNVLAGQNIEVRFNGTSGQRAFIKLNNSSFFAAISIFNPDGTPIAENIILNLGSQAAIDIHNLPQNGSYLILIDPFDNYVGNVTTQASSTANIAIGDPDITVVFTVPDQSAVFNFSGTAGGSISVFANGGGDTFTRLTRPKENHYAEINPALSKNIKGPWIDDIYDFAALLPDPDTISVYQPDGTLLVSVPFSQNISNQALPVTGTFRLEVTPPTGFTGTIRLRLGFGGGGGS